MTKDKSKKINTLTDQEATEKSPSEPRKGYTEKELQYAWQKLFGGGTKEQPPPPLSPDLEVYLSEYFWETVSPDDVSMWYRRGYADGSVMIGLDKFKQKWYDEDQDGQAYVQGWLDARGDLDLS